MIVVKVWLNANELILRTAVNISESKGLTYKKGKQVYLVKDRMTGEEWEIEHSYEDKANSLAAAMLQLTSKVGHTPRPVAFKLGDEVLEFITRHSPYPPEAEE